MIAGTAKNRSLYSVQGMTLESSRTEKPADSAILANRRGLRIAPRLKNPRDEQLNGIVVRSERLCTAQPVLVQI